jgi:endonuclease YncB( thermonuclease family)
LAALGRIALFLAGAALVVALWIGGQTLRQPPDANERIDSRTTKGSSTAESRTAILSDRAEDPAGRESPTIRHIAPDRIAEPRITGPLERAAPREPLAAATKPLKRAAFGPPIPSGTLLYRPVAKAAGEIEADGYTVRLAGIEITPADRTCADGNAPSWPCGVVARTAFRAWMRGRAVACDVPSKPRELTTHCTLDGNDMALWLVENGWAKSAGQYDEAEAKARREKKGMFGPSPLGMKEEQKR